MKKPLVLLLLTLFFFSCEEEQENFFLLTDQGERKNLEFASKELEGVNIGPQDKYGLIKDIYFVDNQLLMHDVKSDSVILTYNVKNKLTSYFAKGIGPDQFVMPEVLKVTEVNNLKSDLYVFEFGKGLFQLDLQKQKKTPIFKLSDYNFLQGVQDAAMTKEGKILTVDTDGHTSFVILDPLNNQHEVVEQERKKSLINSDQYYQAITPKDLAYNKKHDVVITWNGSTNKIDLYQSDGRYMKSYGYGMNENIQENQFDRNYFYFYNLKTEGDYIYSLYAGFNIVDNFVEAIIPRLKSQLFVFNIKTNGIKRYKLDRLINACALDFENEIIYAIEENNEEQPLVKYEIQN